MAIEIDDESRSVIGVDKGSVFQIMDGIANVVADSCQPQIVPDITNKEARDLLGLAESTTKRILKQMVQDQMLKEQGERKNRTYVKN